MTNNQNTNNGKIITIAIDGPVASGKSTVGQLVAQKLNFQYLDTGIMYRAITWLAYFSKTDIENHDEIKNQIINNPIKILNKMGTQISLGGKILESELRSPLIDQLVSDVSKINVVRELLVEQQRSIATNSSGIVMVGRDIGTVVLKDADLKIYLEASIQNRAQRRVVDRMKMGSPTTLPNMIEEIKKRDLIDSTRENSPLIAANDALIIDTDELDQNAVAELISNHANK